LAWTLEEEQETTKGKKSSIMRTWAKPIEEKKWRSCLWGNNAFFCVVLWFQEAAFPTRQNPRRAVERIQRKWWLFLSPLFIKRFPRNSLPKPYGSHNRRPIRNAERN
jgi:hypothetical protein